jgi:hypothetical protein
MIQQGNLPKRVIVFSGFVSLLAIAMVLFSIAGPSSILIEPNEISIEAALPLALLGVLIGCLAVIVCAKYMLAEGMVIFLLLFALECTWAVLTAVFYHLDDEQWLHRWAVEILYESRIGWDYSFLLAGLYGVFSPNLVVGKVINGLVTAILPFLVFRIAHSIFSDERLSCASFYWCCFSIPLLLYGAFSMKESLTAFFLTSALGGLALAKRRALVGWGSAIGFALVLVALRPVYAAIAVSAIGVYLLTPSASRKHNTTRWLMLAITAACSFFFADLIVSDVGSRFSINYLEQLRQKQTFAGQIFSSTSAFSPSNLLIASIGGIYFPPPIRWLLGVGDVIETITMLAWYVILPFFVIGVVRSARSPTRNAIASAVLIGNLVASASIMFAGVAHRHRVPLLPLMCIMAGNGQPTKRQRGWFYAWWSSVLAFNFLYWYARESFA